MIRNGKLAALEKAACALVGLPRFFKKISECFIILIAILFFVGGALASWTGLVQLFGLLFYTVSFDYIIKPGDSILNLIHIAEYLLVGITFFAITARLLFESHFGLKSEADQDQKLVNISDLEKYIIGMVIATISVAFIGLVVGINDPVAADISLKTGIGIGAVITSLGLYLMLSS